MSQADLLSAQADVVGPGERPFALKELSAWENGHRRPGDRNLARIALITGQPFDSFFAPHSNPEG